jgi:glycosyltransferase involved in cell wall biosynthesis
MRICLVSQHYPPETARGGIGMQTWNKAKALAGLGHEVHVLSCAAGGGPGTRISDDDVTVHRVAAPGDAPGPSFPIYTEPAYRMGYSWTILAKLSELIEDVGLDVVDFPEYGAEGLAYQLNRTEANWVPVVIHLHASLAMLASTIGWPEVGSTFHEHGCFSEGMSIRLADGLLACSAGIADSTAAHYGVARDEIEVVYTGVDAGLFHPPAEQRNGGPPTVLFVGNISASKGVETVVEAVLRLRKRRDVRLAIAGAGNGLADELRERVSAAGATDAVDFRGFVEPHDLPDLYRGADVFCSPAQYEGGVANVYCEAMASGCPVVASTAGGAAEAVVDGENGLLVPPLDVGAVTAALDRLLGDPALRARMGSAARRRAEQLFALEPWIARVVAGYERAVDRSRGKLALERSS